MSGNKQRAGVLAIAGCAGLMSFSATADYTLSLTETFATGGDVTAIAIDDIDGDGRDDLIVTTGFSEDPEMQSRVLVYLQQVDGTLAEPISEGFGSGRDIAIGKLDRDSANEVVVEHADGIAIFDWDVSRQREILRSRAHASEFARSGYRIELIDVDRDGALDVVTKPVGSDILIYLGDGQGGVRGTVRKALSINNAVDATSGDFNGDGYRDFAVVSSVLRTYVYLNNGTEGFAPAYVLNPSPTGIALNPAIVAGDFNDDGRDDLAFTTDLGTLSVFEQTPGGALSHAGDLVAAEWGTDAMFARDFDLDGRTDLLVMHSGLELFQQDDDGLLPGRSLQGGGAELAVGDLDGDGCLDVAGSNGTPGISIYSGMGCAPVADLAVDLEIASTSVTVDLQNLGEAPAAAPETVLALSASTGTLTTGSLPGCSTETAGPRSARITCIGGTIGAGSGQSLVIPITMQSDDRRNVLSVSAMATTVSHEVTLGNNATHKMLRTGEP